MRICHSKISLVNPRRKGGDTRLIRLYIGFLFTRGSRPSPLQWNVDSEGALGTSVDAGGLHKRRRVSARKKVIKMKNPARSGDAYRAYGPTVGSCSPHTCHLRYHALCWHLALRLTPSSIVRGYGARTRWVRKGAGGPEK
ncbi:hypothetical protein BOTBODRAFT_222093 [Botryobasidium botryosum FD-172 SS1]|uniref:Uncharacterized protein n=1 Tax=Botryobasidium botryosum (strain FD-172 SS1) TaxID=930990 RepID=A0A067MQK3_BOTB1|nr:hypothetical protein BOTBODRAFT_222093 [Botryobasidium botryosum FD-172 SS1]